MSKRFHLSWFVNGGFRAPGWNTRWEGTSSRDWVDGGFYVDAARAFERACFDMIMVADGAFIADTYGGSMEVYLKYGQNAPKGDPAVLAPLLADATHRLGVVPTFSTTEWRPFQVARWLSTADHMSRGRTGWNIVTSSSDLSAQNFGRAAQPPHDVRYEMAEEFVELTKQLWGSWDADARVMDAGRGVYVDHTKVRTIDFKGEYFASRGPLNTLPSPQYHPVLLQAGVSPRGREFAARHVDMVIGGVADSLAAMRSFRTDLRSRAKAFGRDPDSLKVLFLASPVLGDTDAEAWERALRVDEERNANTIIEASHRARNWGIDLSKLDLDAPLPRDMRTNGHQGTLQAAIDSGRTVRDLVGDRLPDPDDDLALVGSSETVAARLGAINEAIDGDGFLLTKQLVDRRYIAEVTDGLVPALQRRGLVRDHYETATLREHLMEF